MRTVVSVVWVVLALGCGDDPAELLVDLKTDLTPGDEFDTVQTTLVGADMEDHIALVTANYGRGVRVAELDADQGSYELLVRLNLAGAEVVDRTVRITLNEGSRALTVVITRDCRGVSCPGAGDSPEATTCLGGACVAPTCSPDDPTSCGAGECVAQSDCPDMAACAQARCLENFCFYEAQDMGCRTGEICHVERGCIPLPEMRLDAGPGGTDAGPGGTDAGPARDGCIAVAETCNGADDDCDLAVDEEPDTLCPDAPGATGSCDEGSCATTCNVGSHDCDGMEANGCEADLMTSAAHCGACGAACSLTCTMGSCLPGGRAAFSLGASSQGTCAVRGDGSVACWGYDGDGQLGDGSPGLESEIPTDVMALPPAQQVEGGTLHVCALAGGTVWCWGSNRNGQLGDGTTMDRSVATTTGLGDVVDIALGRRHTCAVESAGQVFCWGRNDEGQLGLGSGGAAMELSPAMSGVSDAIAVEANYGHFTCALRSGGTVSCWGDDQFGSLGRGTTMDSPDPLDVSKLSGIAGLTVGEFHGCGWNAAGSSLSCWGGNGGFQIGDGTMMHRPSPVSVSAGGTVGSMAAGTGHTCALTGTTLRCWGWNDQGQLGRGTVTMGMGFGSSAPVTGLTNVTQVTAGSSHTCAVRNDGAVFCWGSNTHGRAGQTRRTGPYGSPQRVSGI